MNSKLPIKIVDLLRQRTVEGERIEYKAGWNPESVLHTICVFANDFYNLGGGYIVIGVEERNGRPVLPPTGIDPDSLDAIQKEILSLGHHALSVHERAVQEHAPEVTPQVGTQSGLSRDQVTGEVTSQVTQQVTPQVHKLVTAIHGELTRAEIMEGLGLKDRMHFANDYLQPALDAGLIEMTIPDKPRSSKQRYRLTEKGQRWLVGDAGESA